MGGAVPAWRTPDFKLFSGVALSSPELISGVRSSPVSFQQLTSTQSRISPLDPVFPPFVEIKVRISLPSNNMTIRTTPREKCTNQIVLTRFDPQGEP